MDIAAVLLGIFMTGAGAFLALLAVSFFYMTDFGVQLARLEWLAVDDFVEQGHPRMVCVFNITLAHHEGLLETRPRDRAKDWREARKPFRVWNVGHFEYRFKAPGPRKDHERRKITSRLWRGAGLPAHA